MDTASSHHDVSSAIGDKSSSLSHPASITFDSDISALTHGATTTINGIVDATLTRIYDDEGDQAAESVASHQTMSSSSLRAPTEDYSADFEDVTEHEMPAGVIEEEPVETVASSVATEDAGVDASVMSESFATAPTGTATSASEDIEELTTSVATFHSQPASDTEMDAYASYSMDFDQEDSRGVQADDEGDVAALNDAPLRNVHVGQPTVAAVPETHRATLMPVDDSIASVAVPVQAAVDMAAAAAQASMYQTLIQRLSQQPVVADRPDSPSLLLASSSASTSLPSLYSSGSRVTSLHSFDHESEATPEYPLGIVRMYQAVRDADTTPLQQHQTPETHDTPKRTLLSKAVVERMRIEAVLVGLTKTSRQQPLRRRQSQKPHQRTSETLTPHVGDAQEQMYTAMVNRLRGVAS
ncbi:hypothetical protein RI367_008421 [Sorochytrium milnesiophthora]